jgi:ribonuclease BN (tRNA processing enzyme)
MKLTVIGSGDAFGSGGRRQASYLLETSGQTLLIDCGATTVMGFNALGLDTKRVRTIVISHLHGDHFAGLVWWLVHALFVVKRSEPLTVWGPIGVEARTIAAAEILFPGCSTVTRNFTLNFKEMAAGTPAHIEGLTVSAFAVVHPSGAPSHALRFESNGKTLAFTGDSGWTDALTEAGRGADLYIMECYSFARDQRYHLSWATIQGKLSIIGAKRTLLTHMSDDMLAHRSEVTDQRVILAHDGLVVDV